MDKVPTVSDTKRNFYTYHTHPINSIYRRVVEELMVEMHLLSVNANFRYDPIYALGVVTAFDQFMQGYQPPEDKDSIFNALCKSIAGEPQKYRQDAESLKKSTGNLATQELVDWLKSPTPLDGSGGWLESVQAIANNSDFKYSRLFAIGLYTLLEQSDSEVVKDNESLEKVLKQLSEVFQLEENKENKMIKDLELYRGNLEKMNQAKAVLLDALEADRKKRQKRALEKKSPNSDTTAEETETPKEETQDSAPTPEDSNSTVENG